MAPSVITSLQRHYGCFYDESKKILYFSIYSANAERIELCFFSEFYGTNEDQRFEMIRKDHGVWICEIPSFKLAPGLEVLYYGYRLWGPNWVFTPEWQPGSDLGFVSDCDEYGNRFNPNKLLIDPWATEISHDPPPRLCTINPNEYDAIFYSGEESRTIDTSKQAPKSMFTLHIEPSSFGDKPKRLLKDDIIYEVHIRGFTRQDSSLPEKIRGTYKGAGLKAPYCKALGITAIEFLPVFQFASEQNDDNDARGDNYWGYMPLGYFAPNRRYAFDRNPGGPTREFKEMVKAFHDVGIKVILDVVYNHTGEGVLRHIDEDTGTSDEDGIQDPSCAALLSFRGIDNASYYTLRSSNNDRGIPNQRYQDNSACGPNLNAASPVVRTLVLDSLEYWSKEMGVDGFRFDLAPVLGNVMSADLFHFDIGDPDNLLNCITRQLPVRSLTCPEGVDLIAEPWAIGTGNVYQLGQFPDGWAEWNDVYRKTARRVENKLRIHDPSPYQLVNIISGSEYQFRRNSSRKEPCPWNSINYVASHDGYSLRDVFAFIGNEDSWNHDGILQEQRKAVRNAIVLLMTSAGVPMICGGDELYRTQGGQTDIWAIDDASQHLDWSIYNAFIEAVRNNRIDQIERYHTHDIIRLHRFMTVMIALRRRYASLRTECYYTGLDISGKGIKDITWYCSDGREMGEFDRSTERFLAWRIDNQEYARQGDTGSLYAAWNWSDATIECTLPPPLPGMRWYRYADTAGWFEYVANIDPDPVMIDREYIIHPRSMVVLFER